MQLVKALPERPTGSSPGDVHHIELWVADLTPAAERRGWLLGELGYEAFRTGRRGGAGGATGTTWSSSSPSRSTAPSTTAAGQGSTISRSTPGHGLHSIAWSPTPRRTAGSSSSPSTTRTRGDPTARLRTWRTKTASRWSSSQTATVERHQQAARTRAGGEPSPRGDRPAPRARSLLRRRVAAGALSGHLARDLATVRRVAVAQRALREPTHSTREDATWTLASSRPWWCSRRERRPS